MFTVSAQKVISTGHRLPSYEGICSSPHGHNMKFVAEVTVEDGYFLDFKEVSRWLDDILEPMDHAMVLFHKDPLLPVLERFAFRLVSLSVEPTTEALGTYVFNQLVKHAKAALVRVSSVTVHETDKYTAVVTQENKQVYVYAFEGTDDATRSA